MKKLVAVILVMILALSLMACGKDAADSGTSAPPASSPDASPAGSPPPSAAVAPTVGTVDDDVDYFTRDPYKFVYAHYDNRSLEQEAWESFQMVAGRFNYEVSRMSGDSDDETFLNNLQALIDRGGIDGLLVQAPNTIDRAVCDVLDSGDIPYIIMFSPFYDDQNRCILPSSALNQYDTGYESMKFLIDIRENYWGAVDPSEIGLLTIDFSVVPVLHERAFGIDDAFKEAFPNNGDNMFYFDAYSAPTGTQMESGYDATTQIITANPGVKYWLICGTIEEFSQGAARAAESLGMESNILITAIGTTVFKEEWESGYHGSWVSTIAIYTPGHTTPGVLALIAFIEGRATPFTIWPQFLRPGDFASIWEADFKPVTFDGLYDYLEEMRIIYGW